MKSARDIKRKINTIKSTQKITGAMKMVAAAKLRRAQISMNTAKPYSEKIKNVVYDISKHIDDRQHPFLLANGSENICVVLVTSDRGLCGAFNSNVIRKFTYFASDYKASHIKVITVGKSGFDSLKRKGFEIIKSYTTFAGRITYNDAVLIGKFITDLFIKQEIGTLYILYNEFKNVAYQTPVVFKLLPVESISESTDKPVDFIYEPEPDKLINEIMPRYLNFLIYSKLLESIAGEHGARMAAMDNATRNAGEMIESLTLYYNKIRQASITMEILDIVNCAEALR
jgi:F-type H+-transporting ATPase subunit gamma